MARTKTNKTHSVPINFFIRDITVSKSDFLVDKNHLITNKSKLSYVIEVDYNFETTTGHLDLTFTYVFYEGETQLHFFETNNSFVISKASIPNLDDEIIMQKYLLNMTELVLNHSRGIHSYMLKDSFMGKYYIPLIEQKNLGKIIKTKTSEL